MTNYKNLSPGNLPPGSLTFPRANDQFPTVQSCAQRNQGRMRRVTVSLRIQTQTCLLLCVHLTQHGHSGWTGSRLKRARSRHSRSLPIERGDSSHRNSEDAPFWSSLIISLRETAKKYSVQGSSRNTVSCSSNLRMPTRSIS